MVQSGSVRTFFYVISVHGLAGSAGLIGLMGGVLALNTKENEYFAIRPIQSLIIKSLQDYALPIYILLGLAVVAFYTIRMMGDPRNIKLIQFILDNYRAKVFANFDSFNDPQDHHRVTLFKLRKGINFSWRFKNRNSESLICSKLKPMLRSGNSSKNSQACFRVYDQSTRNEGVAGMAWSAQALVLKSNLPNINKTGMSPARFNAALKRYCESTKCSEEMVRGYIARGRPLSVSIGATTVMVGDNMWGVLVLDSQRKDGVTFDSFNNYTLTVSVIGKLLERT